MSIESWSDNIIIAELQDDPQLTDDLTALLEQLVDKTNMDVVLSFSGVNYVNSSNIAKVLKLRKKILTNRRKLVLCGINTNVWGIFLVTGLDKVFDFADSLSTGLASVQLDGRERAS